MRLVSRICPDASDDDRGWVENQVDQLEKNWSILLKHVKEDGGCPAPWFYKQLAFDGLQWEREFRDAWSRPLKLRMALVGELALVDFEWKLSLRLPASPEDYFRAQPFLQCPPVRRALLEIWFNWQRSADVTLTAEQFLERHAPDLKGDAALLEELRKIQAYRALEFEPISDRQREILAALWVDGRLRAPRPAPPPETPPDTKQPPQASEPAPDEVTRPTWRERLSRLAAGLFFAISLLNPSWLLDACGTACLAVVRHLCSDCGEYLPAVALGIYIAAVLVGGVVLLHLVQPQAAPTDAVAKDSAPSQTTRATPSEMKDGSIGPDGHLIGVAPPGPMAAGPHVTHQNPTAPEDNFVGWGEFPIASHFQEELCDVLKVCNTAERRGGNVSIGVGLVFLVNSSSDKPVPWHSNDSEIMYDHLDWNMGEPHDKDALVYLPVIAGDGPTRPAVISGKLDQGSVRGVIESLMVDSFGSIWPSEFDDVRKLCNAAVRHKRTTSSVVGVVMSVHASWHVSPEKIPWDLGGREDDGAIIYIPLDFAQKVKKP